MGIEEQLGDTVRLALGKYWSFFGLSGLALVVFAAGDGFPKWLVQLAPEWQWLTFGCGCVLLAACFAAVLAEVRRQPDRGGAAELKGIAAQVLSPGDHETVSGALAVMGTLGKPLPDDYELWVFGCAGGAPPGYWALGRAEVSGSTWACRVTSRWVLGAEASYVMAVVGPNGQALVELYTALNQRCVQLSGQWGGAIQHLPDDIRVCSPARWVRWPGSAAPA